jgi:hypothetical protein
MPALTPNHLPQAPNRLTLCLLYGNLLKMKGIAQFRAEQSPQEAQ